MVGRSVIFYACFTLIGSWMGDKNFRVGIFLNNNLLGLGYRKQTTFFLGLNSLHNLKFDKHQYTSISINIYVKTCFSDTLCRASSTSVRASSLPGLLALRG